MAIIIKPEPVPKVEPDIEISAYNADLIRDIRSKLGPVAAMRVTRGLTGASLLDAKDFVDSLVDK